MPFANAFKALYAYTGAEEDELSFEEDEILCALSPSEVIEMFGEEAAANRDPEWIYARPVLKQETSGLVPLNYVESVEPLGRLRAEYDYVAQEDNELSFNEDEQLLLLSRLNDDSWWLVKNMAGLVGLVPSNYLKELEEAVVESEIAEIDELPVDFPQESDKESIELLKEDSPPLWIDTVTIVKEWPYSVLGKGSDARNGSILITKDNILAFVSIEDRSDVLFWTPLTDIISYDRDYQLLTVRCEMDEQRLHLKVGSKDGDAEELLKAIHASGPLSPLPVNLVDGQVMHAKESPSLPLSERPPSAISSPTLSTVSSKTLSPLAAGPMVKALYAHIPQAEDELQVKAGERLVLIDDNSSADWWLVQRLYGSRRRGLVPSSYLVPDEENHDDEDSQKGISVTSPYSAKGSPGSLPNTPKLAFLEELRERALKSPVAISISQMEAAERAKEALETRSMLKQKEVEREMETLSNTEVNEVKLDDEENEVEPACSQESKAETFEHEIENNEAEVKLFDPTEVLIEKPEQSNDYTNSVQPTAEEAMDTEFIKQSQLKSVELQQEKEVKTPKFARPLEQKSSQALKALETNRKETTPSAALAAVLLKKKHDIDSGKISTPAPVVPKKSLAGPNAEASDVKKNNPWSNISLAKREKTSLGGNVGNTTARSLPSRPEKAQSLNKPIPANTRLWKDRTGAFQVEAEYCGLKQRNPFHVELHKLNGQRIVVPLDRLSQRDIDYVRRREGIPEDVTKVAESGESTKAFYYDGIDWMLFFVKLASIDATNAKQYARRMVQERIGEKELHKINRDWLVKNLFDDEISGQQRHIDFILDALARQKQIISDQEATRRNLEAIKLYSLQPKNPPQPPQKSRSSSKVSVDAAYAPAIFGDLQWSSRKESTSHAPERKSIRDFPVLSPTSPRGSIVTRMGGQSVSQSIPNVQPGIGGFASAVNIQSIPTSHIHNGMAANNDQRTFSSPGGIPLQTIQRQSTGTMPQFPTPFTSTNPVPFMPGQFSSFQTPLANIPMMATTNPTAYASIQRHSEPAIRPPMNFSVPQTMIPQVQFPVGMNPAIMYTPGTATTTTVQRYMSSSGIYKPNSFTAMPPQPLPSMMLATEWPQAAPAATSSVQEPASNERTIPNQTDANSSADRYAILRQVDPHGPSFIQ